MDARTRGVNCKKKQLCIVPKANGYGHAEIRTIRDRPIWHLMREYLNALETNTIFTRKDLLGSVYGDLGIHMRRYATTVDGYMRCITIVKCIESAGIGKYKKLKNIPIDLSITKLKKHVHGNNWESWFIPVEEI